MDPPAPPLVERIVRNLRAAPRPRSTCELAREFLGVADIDEQRAEELLGAVLVRDSRLVRGASGWCVRDGAAPSALRLDDPALAVFAPRRPVVAAFVARGAPSAAPLFTIACGGESEVLRAEERLGRAFPRPVLDLGRVHRRLRGCKRGAGPVELAESTGTPHVEAESPDAFAAIAAAVGERLAADLSLEGVDDFAELERLLEQRLERADFSGKAFGPENLAELPAAPGVYLFADRRGRALYVGQSACLAARVASYFVGPPRDEKDRRLRAGAVRLVTRTVDSAPDALLLEARWIRRRRPELNTRVAVHGAADEDGILALEGPGERGRLVLFVLRRGGLRLRVAAAPGPRRRALAIARAVAALFGPVRRGALDPDAAALLGSWRRTHPETLFLRPAVDGGPREIAGRLGASFSRP